MDSPQYTFVRIGQVAHGRYLLEIDIKVRMISYWCKLIQGKQSKLSTIAYTLLYVKNCKISAWINHIHKI
jgi:hypothetical protein